MSESYSTVVMVSGRERVVAGHYEDVMSFIERRDAEGHHWAVLTEMEVRPPLPLATTPAGMAAVPLAIRPEGVVAVTAVSHAMAAAIDHARGL